MAQQRGLGKGFDSLIPTKLIDEEFDPTAKDQKIEVIAVAAIEVNPNQPRKEFREEAQKALALSIDMHGLLQPIVVTTVGNKYRLIAGERRWRAFQLLGKDTIPAIVRSAEQQAQMELALIENLQREDLNILEVATALHKLADEFDLKNDEVAKRVGRSASSVQNIIRLLDLPKEAKLELAKGSITEGHARQILSLKGQPQKQAQLLEYILKYKWSVRQAENFVKRFKEAGATTEQAIKRVQATTPTTDQLSKYLKTKVHLRHMAKTNHLVIEYKTDEELERLAKNIMKA